MLTSVIVFAAFALMFAAFAYFVSSDVRKRSGSKDLAIVVAVIVLIFWPLAVYVWAFVRGYCERDDITASPGSFVERRVIESVRRQGRNTSNSTNLE